MKSPASALTLPCQLDSWVWHSLLQKAREGCFPVQWSRTHCQLSELYPATQNWVRGILWGILALLCSYICLSNRVQGSLNSEGYHPLCAGASGPLQPIPDPRFEGIQPCQLHALWSISYTLPFCWPGLVFTVLLCLAMLEGCYRASSNFPPTK